MATLQTSGAISLANIASVMGGGAPHSLSEYYRFGGLTPGTRGTTSSYSEGPFGELSYYPPGDKWGPVYRYCWLYSSQNMGGVRWGNRGDWPLYTETGIFWSGPTRVASWGIGVDPTSYTVGNITYYRGSLLRSYDSGYGTWHYAYRVSRTVVNTSSTNINTNVPTAGQVSFSQFFGAENP